MVQKIHPRGVIGVPNSGPYVKRFQIREFLSKCSILEPFLIYHISLCKYYTGPLDPGIFGHDRSKKPSLLNNLLFLLAGPPNFWSICWFYYKFEYIYTKDRCSKKDTKHSSNALLSFLLHQSLYTLYVH